MKNFNTFLTLLLALFCLQAHAQIRYLDQVFDEVSVETDVVYATNLSVITGEPAATDLMMDIYQPVEDEPPADRPVVLLFHTGSYLPPLFNGQITGSRSDSVIVEIATRLAKSGYVAAAVTYRLGWNPTAPDQNVRTGTLLNAVYRSVQDARSAIRFFRKTVAEDGNPYNVDPDRTVLWGSGTGGYVALNSAYLDRYEEISSQEKFLNSATLEPYVDTALMGDVYGLTQAPLCLPNHVGYSSDFAISVNMGGALGDESWVEGLDNEPAAIGFHVPTDPFAPFVNGAVIVPTTNEFVVNVSGTRVAIEKVNEVGSNDVFDEVNAELLAENDPLTLRVQALSETQVEILGQQTTLATENMYTFLTEVPSNIFDSSPWDWWDKATLDLVVAGTNAQLGTDFNADSLHQDGLLTNPDMSPEKGKMYVDTIMNYYMPRAYAALNLMVVGTEEILSSEAVNLQVGPNPATEQVVFQTDADHPMKQFALYDMNGRLIQMYVNINEQNIYLKRGNLPPGIYLAKIRFDEGIVTQKVVFK